MGDAPAILGLAHELLVDVIGRQVAGDPGEQVNIALGNRLAEGCAGAKRRSQIHELVFQK